MTIHDLIESLSGIDPDSETFVVLFKNDGTSEQFEIDAVTNINGTAHIEISEPEGVE
jgi:hypothetical protein